MLYRQAKIKWEEQELADNIIYDYVFQGGQKAVSSQVMSNFNKVKTAVAGVNADIADIQAAITELQNKPTYKMWDIYFSFKSETPTGAFPL